VANHVTAFDGPLVVYALPGQYRRWIATAMLGEMLEDYRHWRNPNWTPGHKGFYILGPPAYWLVTRCSMGFLCRASATSSGASPMRARLWTTATT